MRYRLRTLLLLLAVGPPMLAAAWFDFAYVLLALAYFATLAAVLPVAAFLWRNSALR